MAELEYPRIGYGITPALEDGAGSYNWPILVESGTGDPVRLMAQGIDDNISIEFVPKGTGTVIMGAASFTPSITVGSGLANYTTISGAVTGSPALYSALGSDTHIGIGLLPKGSYPTTSTKLLLAPTTSWVAGSANFVTRIRPQLQVFQSSTTATTGTGFYPQFSVTGGSVSGFADVGGAGLAYFNNITVDNDNVVANSGTGPQGLTLFGVNLGVGNASGATGGAHKGGRNALSGEIFINSDIDIGAGSLFHVGVAGGTTAYRKMGGIAGSNRGNVFGGNLWARALGGSGGGPRYLASLVGMEFGLRQEANVSALWKMGLQIVEENTSAANAEQQNIGLSITNQPSATTIGYGQGISFGAYNGQFPIAPSGQVIATLPTPIGLSSFVASDGVNLSRIAFSRAAFETTGFYVDGSGNTGGQTVGGLALQTVSAVNAKVSTVSSVTVVEGGSFDGGNPAPMPTFTIASPATSGGIAGVTATMTVTNMGAVGFTGISAGGSGYTAGDVLTASGGTGTAFTITVETVTSGQPTNIRVETAGNYTVLPTNPISFTGGTGTGFTCGMRWTILTVSRTAGTNYNELRPPAVTYTGLAVQTKEARFKVAMTAGTTVDLVLNAGGNTKVDVLTSATNKPLQVTGQTNGAGASAGTLANAPAVGNPAFWLPVSINGTNRWIPAW